MSAGELSISVVVVTDGRARALETLLAALGHVAYPQFEVIIVAGPSADGAAALLETWAGRVKAARCAARNISAARNIGVSLAAGEVVAFIDDDAIPEARWLADLAPAYGDGAAAGAGGVVFDHDGAGFQHRFSAADRFGAAHALAEPAGGDFPLSAQFPHFLGANCSFRRAALVAAGGFDEEFEYFLDETDVCCRLVDAGWRLTQIDGAAVHHKFLASGLRGADRILSSHYAVLKNSLYFMLKNGADHVGLEAASRKMLDLIDHHRRDVERHAAAGRLSPVAAADFAREADAALRAGFARGLSGARRLRPPEFFAAPPAFLRFAGGAAQKADLIVASWSRRDDPEIARRIAGARAARLILAGAPHHDVTFADGLWRHDTAPVLRPRSAAVHVPEQLWARAAGVLAAVELYAPYVDFGEIVDISGEGLSIGLALAGRKVRVAAPIAAAPEQVSAYLAHADRR